jgi:adenylylsulfate kinase
LGVNVQVLESDKIRSVLTPHPEYSPEERDLFYTSLVYIGELLTLNGVNIIFDATANKRRWRNEAKKKILRFMEVYINTPLEVCKIRDPKGIYVAAETGKAIYVPGEQEIYEEPESPDLTLDGTLTPEQNASKILKALRSNGYI